MELNAFDKADNDSFLKRLAEKLKRMWTIPRGLVIDSGAATHVIPKGWLSSIPAEPSAGSKKGIHYIAATGNRVPNEGRQRVPFWTEEGVGLSWIFQVTKVNKPLVSVGKLIEEGWRIVFDEEASYIKHKKTEQIMAPSKERGVSIVKGYVEKDPETVLGGHTAINAVSTQKPERVFRRQAP